MFCVDSPRLPVLQCLHGNANTAVHRGCHYVVASPSVSVRRRITSGSAAVGVQKHSKLLTSVKFDVLFVRLFPVADGVFLVQNYKEGFILRVGRVSRIRVGVRRNSEPLDRLVASSRAL